jgi:putative transposase
VFEVDEEREAYLGLLRQYMAKHGVSLWAYCLMTNHVHLIMVPEEAESLSRALRDAHTVYAMRFNQRTKLGGHVWQGRFYSCAFDDAHVWAAVRYVERNPVRAGLVERAEDYRWSSAAAHCGLRDDGVLAKGFPPEGAIEDWRAWLTEEEDEAVVEAIRRHTTTGRPCGSPAFVERVEAVLGRRLRPQKRGRKRHRVALKDRYGAEEENGEIRSLSPNLGFDFGAVFRVYYKGRVRMRCS